MPRILPELREPSLLCRKWQPGLLASQPGVAHLCESCSELDLTQDIFEAPFDADRRFHTAPYAGTFGALRTNRSICDLCQLIAFALERDDDKLFSQADENDIWRLEWDECDYKTPSLDTGNCEAGKIFGLYLQSLVTNHESRYSERMFVGLLNGADSLSVSHKLVGDSVDLQVVKSWITGCRSNHQECASFATSRTGPRGLRVIDVQSMCLTDLPPDATYVALSYVWANSNFVTTLHENEELFMEENGLDIQLPQTVRDAIDVTTALGLRFLWIDALCITQDDDELKKTLIASMGDVYSNALLTLVAASSDGADSGLSGWTNEKGRCTQHAELACGSQLSVFPDFANELEWCNYRRRAWTYQESAMSARCLVFLNGYVYFVCKRALYSEPTGSVPLEINTISVAALGRRGPDPYREIMKEYTQRKLSYQSDALNAITGLLSRLAPAIGASNMLLRLPNSIFDLAVIWARRYRALVRRPAFASWSWVGWQGAAETFRVPTEPKVRHRFQDWLIEGTWIDWFIVRVNGTCQPVWDCTATSTLGSTADAHSREPSLTPISYKTSASDNPFGRTIEWPSLSPLRRPPPAQHVEFCRTQYLSEALYFVAPIIRLKRTSFIAEYDEYGAEADFMLVNELSMEIGCLKSDEKLTEEGVEVTLVVTSIAPPLALDTFAISAADSILATLDVPPRIGRYPEDDYFSVLYIRERKDEFAKVVAGEETTLVQMYERAGVGLVFRHALKQSIPWETIVLV